MLDLIICITRNRQEMPEHAGTTTLALNLLGKPAVVITWKYSYDGGSLC